MKNYYRHSCSLRKGSKGSHPAAGKLWVLGSCTRGKAMWIDGKKLGFADTLIFVRSFGSCLIATIYLGTLRSLPHPSRDSVQTRKYAKPEISINNIQSNSVSHERPNVMHLCSLRLILNWIHYHPQFLTRLTACPCFHPIYAPSFLKTTKWSHK